MITDEQLLQWARFVATKFESNEAGWQYTRDLGKLKHIRFEEDYTGYNYWTKRLRRAMRSWNPFEYWAPKNSLNKMFQDKPKSLRGYLIHAYAYTRVALRKDKHLPDGILNGNIIFWEEDGEYGALFGPTVGVKVLDFIDADPENPHAVAIVEEMRRMALLSFPGEEREDESS